jgi:hypothetical protein
MTWLRGERISFIAFRPRSGAATGAHVHVGELSSRLPFCNGSTRPATATVEGKRQRTPPVGAVAPFRVPRSFQLSC